MEPERVKKTTTIKDYVPVYKNKRFYQRSLTFSFTEDNENWVGSDLDNNKPGWFFFEFRNSY